MEDERRASNWRPRRDQRSSGCFSHRGGLCYRGRGRFQIGQTTFRKGWRHNGSEHPINESAEVARITDALHLQKPQLAKIALDLENVATALATAKTACDADIGALDARLHQIDDAIGTAKANNQDASGLRDEAVAAVRATFGSVQKGRDGYVAAMAAANLRWTP